MSSSILSEEFIVGFLESYPAVVSVFELDGTIVFANEQCCRYLNKSKAELIGTHVQDFIADTTLTASIISKVISRGHVEDEMRVAQSDGTLVDIRLTAVLVRDRADKPMLIVGMVRGAKSVLEKAGDITQVMQHILDQFPEANMLTVQEVANELRVSKETVRRWTRSGRLPSVKLPHIRIPSGVVKDLIRKNLE
jgi:PAS domain S-box-containing protein/excisionase family DNA binding protein